MVRSLDYSSPASSSTSLASVSSIVKHILASKHDRPNAFGAKIPVSSPLNIAAWESRLQDYHDSDIVKFLRFGWPINYTADSLPEASVSNHPSAISFSDHVDYYIATELEHGAIAGPFHYNPLPRPLICSPLQTVPKRGSTKRRVVMDLSFPPSHSVNSGIPDNSYLNEHYKLRLPGIDRLCQFILQHGRGCLLYKLDLQRAYRQLPIDPKDYFYIGFRHRNMLYFDTRCPFGLKTSAMICQRTTKAVVYCFTQAGFFADVYLDDFYGADVPARAPLAFQSLKNLLHELGLRTSPDKDCPPSTNMVCLGVEVDSEHFTLSVTATRVQDLLTELAFWASCEFYTLKQLKSLLGKLSFVAACVTPGRIFMSRLLNNLRAFPSSRPRLKVSADMQADIDWWLTFLPLFNGTSLIKPRHWEFDDLQFTTDASMNAGGATCLDECFTCKFPEDIVRAAQHITALELYTIVVAVRFWAPKLYQRKFIVSCDNEAAVTVLNSGSSKDSFMQRCLRQLWFTAALYDCELTARHIPGVHNVLADALSRWHTDPAYQELFHASASRLRRQYTFRTVPRDYFNFQVS